MSYELETTSQIYGNQSFLTHNIKGDGPESDRYLFGMRVPSYGIFSFGSMNSGTTKRVVLASEGIVSPISLLSAYAFGFNATADEIRFRLLSGNTPIAEQRITSTEMPFRFPEGAIIDPSLAIEVEPRYNVTQLMIYWQPVHILKYVAVN